MSAYVGAIKQKDVKTVNALEGAEKQGTIKGSHDGGSFRMKRMILGFFGLLISCSTLHFPNREPATSPGKRLQVLALTDLHGTLEPKSSADGRLRYGGAALLSGYVQTIKRQSTLPTVIIDGGDLFQGTLVSNLGEGAAVVRFYNALGVDATAIGNHEFDYGPGGPRATPSSPNEEPRGALIERMKEARFPMLAANIRLARNPSQSPPWARPSTLIQRDGLKIGVIGAATTTTPATTNIGNVRDLLFIDPAPIVAEEARKLRAAGADFVILTLHSGGKCGDNRFERITDLSSCSMYGELDNILARIPPRALDLVIAGHTHAPMAKIVRGFPVIQAASHSTHLGWIILNTDPARPLEKMELVPVCLGTGDTRGTPCESGGGLGLATTGVQPDLRMDSLLAPDFERVRQLNSAPLGPVVTKPFLRDFNRENALGNLLADTLKTRFPDVDTVLLNNGGLRANLAPGPLTYGQVYDVLPFDNMASAMTISGATLLQLIELGLEGKNGAFAWSGLVLKGDLCRVQTALLNGQPIEPGKTYRVLTSDFVATGGIGVDRLRIAPAQVQTLNERILREEAVAGFRALRGPLDPDAYFSRGRTQRQTIMRPCPAGKGDGGL